MKKIWLIFVFSILIIQYLNSQKVGLVLSGGGAPGIAHIGMIKALEENNIPIDYICGTSIGAIVGSMYTMGYTPDQMIQMLKSEEFKHWMSGEPKSENQYDYRSATPTPSLIEFPFSLNGSSIPALPSSYVDATQMNYAFIPLFAQATAAAKGNFDNLMVPFRCVSSDIYNKKAVIFSRGSLGDAVRTSMTFPFMFKPIRVDGELLFDGGIYNNFPQDVMKKDFNPDYTIGSVVAYNTPKAADDDVLMVLQNMVIHRTEYTKPATEGILLNFNLARVDVFDFSKVDELVKIGYDSVIKHIDEIKAHVPRQISANEIADKRKIFHSRFPELKFSGIEVIGVDAQQKQYILSYFPKDNTFSLEQFKQSYYQLTSDEAIQEVNPQADYNPENGLFGLKLKVKIKPSLKLSLGGSISSSGFNQGFAGLIYVKLSNYAYSLDLAAQIGQVYSGLVFENRFDFLSPTKCYLKFDALWHEFNNPIERSPFYFSQQEAYAKLSMGVPLGIKARLEVGGGLASQTDFYSEKSQYSTGKAFLKIESNTQNDKLYPFDGQLFLASAQVFKGNENAGSVSSNWFQLSLKADNYLELIDWFRLGTYLETVYSNRNLLSNYYTTIIQAPAFQPTAYSRTVFNPAFSANWFVAVGLKPVFRLTNQLQLREEAYWFVPYQSIQCTSNNTAAYSKPLSSSRFISETSLVYNFKVASASLFAGNFSGQWNVGLNIGFLLFKPKFRE